MYNNGVLMCLFFMFKCGIKCEILKMSNLKIWAKALHWVLGLHICDSRYGQQRAAVLGKGFCRQTWGILTGNRTSKEQILVTLGWSVGKSIRKTLWRRNTLRMGQWEAGAIRRALHTALNTGLSGFWGFRQWYSDSLPATWPWRS